MLQHYEILYIIPGTKPDDELPTLVQQVHDLLTKGGATIVKTDLWGKRKLAYEIDHIRFGYYEAIDFDMDTEQLTALDLALRHDTTILRFQIIKRKVLTPEQEAATAQLRERIAAKREIVKEKEAAAMLKPEAPVEEPTEAPAPAAPVEQKQLEDKLEEMLDSDKVDF